MIQEAILIDAGRFFTPRRVDDLLHRWGEQLRLWDGATPEAWGWQCYSVDPSQQHSNSSGAPGSLTLPEASVDQLRRVGGDVETIHKLVTALPLLPHYTLKLRYIHELEHGDIAVQVGGSLRVVQQALCAGRMAVRRGLVSLRQRIMVRRRETSSV